MRKVSRRPRHMDSKSTTAGEEGSRAQAEATIEAGVGLVPEAEEGTSVEEEEADTQKEKRLRGSTLTETPTMERVMSEPKQASQSE